MSRDKLKKIPKKTAFTLIELLVVISIIGLLSTLAVVALKNARAKSRDASKQADFKQISTALNLFYDRKYRMPKNYNPCCGTCEGDTYYEQSMQELVNEGLLGKIPKSPGGGSYCYYDYGGDIIGAILVTNLETYPADTKGAPGSCRPFDQNWCSYTIPSTNYCICNPY